MPDQFNIENLTVTNGAVLNRGIINNTVYNAAPAADAALLQDLTDAQNRLADSEALIANAIGELREAIVKKDQKTIAQKMKELTSGTAAEVVKKVAGAAALRFLGLS